MASAPPPRPPSLIFLGGKQAALVMRRQAPACICDSDRKCKRQRVVPKTWEQALRKAPDPYVVSRWWPWDQGTRNMVLGAMLYIWSDFRLSEPTFLLGVSILDRCAGQRLACARANNYDHRYLLGVVSIFLAFKMADGTECTLIPSQGLAFRRIQDPRKFWTYAKDFFNTHVEAEPTTVEELENYERCVYRAVDYRLHFETLSDVVRAQLVRSLGAARALTWQFRAQLLVRFSTLLLRHPRMATLGHMVFHLLQVPGLELPPPDAATLRAVEELRCILKSSVVHTNTMRCAKQAPVDTLNLWSDFIPYMRQYFPALFTSS